MILLLYLGKSTLKIRDDIVDVLCTDGQTDRSRLDACIQKFFLRQLGVCRGSRVDNQRLDVSNVCQEREQFEILSELSCLIRGSLQFESEDRTGTVREVTVVKCFLRRIDCRMVYLFYLRMILQEVNDLQGILYMTLNTERQCLKALQEQEGVERRDRCAFITEKCCSCLDDVSDVTDCLCKYYAMVGRVRLRRPGNLSFCAQSNLPPSIMRPPIVVP